MKPQKKTKKIKDFVLIGHRIGRKLKETKITIIMYKILVKLESNIVNL